jgi:hypothetical protein
LELKAGRAMLSRAEQSLWRSLEESFGQAIVQIAGQVELSRIPSRIDLAPVENHPSLEGLEFYAEQVIDRCVLTAGKHQ